MFFTHEIVCVKFYSIRLQRSLGNMVTKTDPHILKNNFLILSKRIVSYNVISNKYRVFTKSSPDFVYSLCRKHKTHTQLLKLTLKGNCTSFFRLKFALLKHSGMTTMQLM